MRNDAPPVGGSSPARDPFGGVDWDTAARVVRMLEVVQQFAVLDFSDVAPVGDTGDDLDALAAGINMLGEELDGWNHHFHQRVTDRTAELDASVRRLQRFNDQISQLTAMSNLLQVARDRDEACTALARFAPKILADASGAIYRCTPSGEHVEATLTWGPHHEWFPATIPADDCAALRPASEDREPSPDASCEHVAPTVPGRTLCIPLTARGVTVALLSVHDNDTADQAPDQVPASSPDGGSTTERLARAVSEQFALAVTNLELREELRVQSIRDALTGLYNRRYLDEVLDRELRRAHRTGSLVSVLMLDIDHFKDLNDTHGHAAGDAVLSDLAAVLLQHVRGEDIACRYGGEELAVIMAGLDQTQAVARAEQIRTTIADHGFTWGQQPLDQLTASIGVATSPQHADTTDQLLNAADTALYRAKANGRNRVESAPRAAGNTAAR